MTLFTNLPSSLVKSLERLKITQPTPIQIATIPVALDGNDILASAQTGTGKTIAYLIPMIMKLTAESAHHALILTPTRELAIQVHQALNSILAGDMNFRSALLIGGAPMFRQMNDLKRKPRLIVGTPGRITDHLERGSLKLNETRFLIIDEADRMLDMGFEIQLDKIAEFLPETRQTLMFSATVPPNIERLSRKYLRTPQRITVGSTIHAAPTIKQEVIRTDASEKRSQLLQQLKTREGSIIIFVKTKRSADKLSKDLNKEGHNSDAIHGDLPQNRRSRVIERFRTSKSRILVATDVAARGLDIPHLMHVINYDLPDCPEDYIHRIGRTGRSNAEGNALSLVAPEDNFKWKAIDRLMNPHNKDSKTAKEDDREKEGQRRDPRPFRKDFKKKKFSFGEKRFGEKKFGQKKFGERKFGEKKFGQQQKARPKFFSKSAKPKNSQEFKSN